MNLEDCYIEEDLFPKIFTDYEEREYGILFFNTDNKDSYDSNHAVIYKDKIHDLQHVLSDITEFYKEKGCSPIIYQSMLDDNWFEEIKEELSAAGLKSWIEDQEYMLPSGNNRIIPNPAITVTKVSEWNDENECTDRGDNCPDLCVDRMYGVRHLSRRGGYGPDEGY